MYESLAPDLNSTFTESQVLRVTMEQGECLRSSEGELGPQPVDAWKFFPMLTCPPCLSQSSSPSRLLSASHVPLSGSLAPLPGPLPHTCSCTHSCPPTHTPRVVVPAMKRMCLCWVWPVACIPCCSELPSPAFHERVPGLRKAAGMSPLPPSCSGLASPLQSLRK